MASPPLTFLTGTATLWGSPCLAASTRKKTLPLCKKISTPPLPRTALNKLFSPAAFGRLFYLRCALPCTPGCRTEYAVGEAFHSHSKGAYLHEKHRHSTHSGFRCPSVLAHRGCSRHRVRQRLYRSAYHRRDRHRCDLSIEAPSCALSLQEDNTIRPYALWT